MIKRDTSEGSSDSADSALAEAVDRLSSAKSGAECRTAFHDVLAAFDIDVWFVESRFPDSRMLQRDWRAVPASLEASLTRLSDLEKHPWIDLSHSRSFPFDVFALESAFSTDDDVKDLLQDMRQSGVTCCHALPVFALTGEYAFVVGRMFGTISMSELLQLQSICANVARLLLVFRPSQEDADNALSELESTVFKSLAMGMHPDAIATTHRISPATVAMMEKRIVEKLGARNITHAIAIAMAGTRQNIDRIAG